MSLREIAEEAALGGFGDSHTLAGAGADVAVGFIPIVGQIAAVRDMGAAALHIWQGRDGAWVEMGFGAVAIIPGGRLLKAGGKAAHTLSGTVNGLR